jgi:ferredoxin
MKYKIEHDAPGCIGCGACAAICPEFWEMEGAKVKPLKTEFDEKDLGCNKEAAESCPVRVIKIKDETGKEII